MIGIVAVLIGALISTLYGRITSFGLADIRGAVHAGVDEGAWIPTAASVAQMFVGPPAAWFGAVYGPRLVLMISAVVFGVASLLLPFSPNLDVFLGLQVMAGLAVGTFIPLTIGFTLQNIQPKWWPFGIAAYGFSLELSLNIPASIEGFYLDHLSWRWIFWQGAVLAIPMFLCLRLGMPRQQRHAELLARADRWGMVYCGAGFSMLYAALDQGNRLDWLNSGVICGLLAGGAVLLIAFVAHERASDRPWIRLGFFAERNILVMIAILTAYRFLILSTSYLIPQYLTTVQNFRSLDVGRVLIWIAVPQIVLAPLVAWILMWTDPRVVMAVGVAIIGAACALATGLTPDWQTGEFLPSQVMQAVGQTATLIALVLFFTRHLRPADALTFGAVLQTARLFGGELGSAFMQTFVRRAEQLDSYLVGLNVQTGDTDVLARISGVTATLLPRSLGPTDAANRATQLLGQAVRTQASVISFIDGFGIVTVVAIGMLLLVAVLRKPPPQDAVASTPGQAAR